MEPSVLSVSSRAMLDACARLGLDTAAILASANVARSMVDDPDARIPLDRVRALWDKAYELSGDPDLALHAIEVLPFGAYRVLDYLIARAPSVGAGLATLSDYFPLVNNAVRLPYVVGERHVTFGVDAPSYPGVLTRPYAEYTLAACYLHTRITTDPPFGLVRVEFSHARPASVREQERIFGCPVVFDAPACRLVLDRETWDLPIAGHDPTLFSVLDTHARMLLDRLPSADDIVGHVRRAVEERAGGVVPGLEAVAKRLAMSPRTLQRRLREHGVAFNDVLNDVRAGLARTCLAERDIAISEIAYLLGFATQSAFTHTFKRWYGMTPSEYRRRARRDAAAADGLAR